MPRTTCGPGAIVCSYISGRGDGNFEAKAPEDGVMQWGMETPGGQFRYTITLNNTGQWFEVAGSRPLGGTPGFVRRSKSSA